MASRERSTALGVVVIPLGVRHLTRHVGLLTPGTGFAALHPFGDALQPLPFTFRRRALAFVRALLAFVGELLALIRDAVPLISDPISSASDPVASCGLSLAPLQSLLALIQRGGPAFMFLGHVDMAIGDHASP
ncbi:hypothetical protein A5745_00630 [Mycobacterium sp. IS-2888]|nr:hypothetical protein A5745_00630 [Mycobacterium sp. IS-2888]